MRRILTGFMVTVGAIALAALPTLDPVLGQNPKEPAGGPKRPEFTTLVSLPANRDLERRLETARDYIKTGNWQEILPALQEILDSAEDYFISAPKAGPGGKESLVWSSLREQVHQLMGTMPAKGREAYEVICGGKARGLLLEGKQANDSNRLAEVFRRYFYTRAGAEAADLLATRYLDRGRYQLAAACFQKLLRRQQTDISSLTLFKACLAFQRGGNQSRADKTWIILANQSPDGLVLGDRRVALADLKKILDQKPARPAGGGGMHIFSSLIPYPSSIPLTPLETAWEKDTVRTPTGKGWMEGIEQQLRSRGQAIFPGAFPVVGKGLVVFRTQWGIVAVNQANGDLAWESTLEGGLDNPCVPGQGKSGLAPPNDMNTLITTYASMQPQMLMENTLVGTLSNDGQRVYGVEDLAVPPQSTVNQFFAGGGVMIRGGRGRFGMMMPEIPPGLRYNCLFAVNLEGGLLRWTLGREGTPLQEITFLGPPLPVEGKLYVLLEKEQELRLACLEPDTGKVVWMQTLAQVKRPIHQEFGRRTWAAYPAYSGGVLVCPTNSGAVIAFDLVSRSLLWAHAYAQAPPPPPPQMIKLPNGKVRVFPSRVPYVPRMASNWKNSAPIIAGGKVLITGPDADSLHGVNLRDGVLEWKIPWRGDERYLAGVIQDRVVIVGQNSCRAFDLAGKPLWTAITGIPAGQGAAGGKLYYLPVSRDFDNSVQVLDLENGKVVAQLAVPRKTLGNLTFFQDRLLAQNGLKLVAFRPGTPAKK